ncbi:MAG: efflux RND transporter periplasmic adaptor subunit [Rhodanobacter sp.]
MKSRSFFVMPSAPRVASLPLALLTLALAATLALGGCSSKPDQADSKTPAAATTPQNVTMTDAQRKHIKLFTVQSTTYRKTVQANGIVDFDQNQATSVVAAFSGPVTRLLVAPGDKVKQGQALAIVDSPDFAQAVGAYRKSLIAAKNAKRLADMDQDLVKNDGIAQREAAQAQTDAVGAVADRDAALQTLKALSVDPQTIKDIQAGRDVGHVQGTIRSPIAGTVAERLITVGQLLQAGSTPCFTIANLSQVWVMAQIFGPDLTTLNVGDSADIETDDEAKPLAGTLTNISAVVDPDTRAVSARVSVDNVSDVLKKQMYVRVQIHSKQQQTGLLVPVSAVLRDDENLPFVYVVQKDGSFAQRSVTLGYRTDNSYDITAGVHAGDRVVVDGAIFVRFMQTQ